MPILVEPPEFNKPNVPQTPPPAPAPEEAVIYVKEGMVIEKRDYDLYLDAATREVERAEMTVFFGTEYQTADRLVALGLLELVSTHDDDKEWHKRYRVYKATSAGRLLYRMFEKLLWM